MYASRIVVSGSCMPPLIGSSRFMLTRQGSTNARQLTAEKKKDKQVRPTERLNRLPSGRAGWSFLTIALTLQREKKNLVLVSVKSGAEVGVGVEVSLFFFYCNAVLALGLG